DPQLAASVGVVALLFFGLGPLQWRHLRRLGGAKVLPGVRVPGTRARSPASAAVQFDAPVTDRLGQVIATDVLAAGEVG
ncbi:hypothetical protein, partial [Burkholderia sp. SIMBA_024]|uniref:hypothetical protein n=1 Tax=Burkholderia sp. SIMBA_024 TaxID=3085768 RepID=UPI003978C947